MDTTACGPPWRRVTPGEQHAERDPALGAGPAPAAQGAIAIDGGDLSLGSGLLALVRPLVATLAPGGTLAILSSSPDVGDDLATWCRLEHHVYCGGEMIARGRVRHMVVRGPLGVVLANAADAAPASWPAHADARSGFAPRGATVEPGGPAYPFSLVDADRVGPPEVRQLYDQAITGAWDAARDVPWHTVRPLPPALAAAVGQVMTFLAENELAALYVPARFLPRIHPAYVETAMFLATQMSDESRHIDVFLRRAGQGGSHAGISSVTTARSLLSLLEADDFTEASFLLSVLGEGTFLDLLQSSSGNNYGHYKNPRYDALLAQASNTSDLKERGQLLEEAEQIALNDYAVIPTRFLVTQDIVEPYVKGWVPNMRNVNRTRWLSIDPHVKPERG